MKKEARILTGEEMPEPRKKFWKYNIPAAILILCAVVLLSVLLGFNRTDHTVKKDLESLYFGTETEGSGRYGNLSVTVENYLDIADALNTLIGGDAGLTEALERADFLRRTPFGDPDAFLSLTDTVGRAYHTFAADGGASGETQTEAKALFAELEAAQKRLSGSGEYGKLAETHNRTVTHFPGKFVVFSRKTAVLLHN